MTILEKASKYYHSNYKEMDTFLEKTTFLDTNLKYPNSILIKFGKENLIGEISVWNLDFQKYIECEYINLTKLEDEPILKIQDVTSENIIEKLIDIFDELRLISNNNYR